MTSFEKRVYTVVKQIPAGQVRTYAWIARRLKKPRSARAVGNALNKNPFTIIVPCHRVVSSDGSLGGYALGSGLKKKLLDIELSAINDRKVFEGYYVIRNSVKIEGIGQ
ncbi:MAG: MGMT family protein [Candidatus Omnitrophica bacterium]|nr:MGMT family protein [Candidatus Omnitrophota bacterium]